MSAFDILKKHIAEQEQAQEAEEPVVDEAQTTLPLNEPAEPVVTTVPDNIAALLQDKSVPLMPLLKSVNEPIYSDSNYPQLLKEFKEQVSIKGSSIFMGLCGHSGRGKTGIAMDAFMYYRKDNEMMWCYDFDSGANDCKQAHYPGADDIIRMGRGILGGEDEGALRLEGLVDRKHIDRDLFCYLGQARIVSMCRDAGQTSVSRHAHFWL